MTTIKNTRLGVLALIVSLIVATSLIGSTAPTNEECTARFNSTAAASKCEIQSMIGKLKGSTPTCAFQVKCTNAAGATATISSEVAISNYTASYDYCGSGIFRTNGC